MMSLGNALTAHQRASTSSKYENNDPRPRIKPIAGCGLTVEFGEHISERASARVYALDASIRENTQTGITSTTPSFRSLLIRYDPRLTCFAELRAQLREAITSIDAAVVKKPATHWHLPAVYGGKFGADLDTVARHLAMTPHEVLARHMRSTFTVCMLGFQPGFSYLSGLDPLLDLPRHRSPRFSAHAGTLKIGAGQAAIQSMDGPSGWHWIARTPVPMFDPGNDPPALLAPGDQVSFEPIEQNEFSRLAAGFASNEIDLSVFRNANSN